MNSIQIGGLVSFTTIDYPDKLSAVLFLVGCPLRCAYCSNPHLLCPHDGEYDADKVFDWIKSRAGKLEAIVFSGGEALMQGDLTIDYMRRVRNLGFKIGLHTNGFYPETLTNALDTVDWIGLDYKATKNNYARLTGQDFAYDNMLHSLDICVANNKDCEVRITCDPHFVSTQDLLDIAKDAAARGAKKFAVQKYIPYTDGEKSTISNSDILQFFNNSDLRNEINSLFESVIWRE